MDGTAIDAATEADLPGLVDLFWEVASEGRWLGTEVPFDREARAEAFQTTLGRADARFSVARATGRVVGALWLIPHRSGLLTLGMAVGRAHRSRGLGSRLLADAIAWARSSGAHKIALEVFPHNAPAIALYERHGFVREGYFTRHQRRRDGTLWDTIPMGLLLVPA